MRKVSGIGVFCRWAQSLEWLALFGSLQLQFCTPEIQALQALKLSGPQPRSKLGWSWSWGFGVGVAVGVGVGVGFFGLVGGFLGWIKSGGVAELSPTPGCAPLPEASSSSAAPGLAFRAPYGVTMGNHE